jgi:cytochrome c oxidase subunit 3
VHALHVLGGLVAIGWVLGRWHRPAAVPQRRGSVAFTAMYWHFLGIAWIAFYALLWWAAP